MPRLLTLSLLSSLLALSSGCALCCAPYDCHYLYQGGAWTRSNPTGGRVGSAFDPAGAPVAMASAPATEPTLAPPPSGDSTPVPGTPAIPRELGETYLPTE